MRDAVYGKTPQFGRHRIKIIDIGQTDPALPIIGHAVKDGHENRFVENQAGNQAAQTFLRLKRQLGGKLITFFKTEPQFAAAGLPPIDLKRAAAFGTAGFGTQHFYFRSVKTHIKHGIKAFFEDFQLLGKFGIVFIDNFFHHTEIKIGISQAGRRPKTNIPVQRLRLGRQ